MKNRLDRLDEAFHGAVAAHEAFIATRYDALIRAADAMTAALRQGHKILSFGNGGSAADAQHFAAELVGRFLRERRALAAIALTTDTSILTAIGNDLTFDRVFVRQIEALGRPGDVVLGITTSGTSQNVVAALESARTLGMTSVALVGREPGRAGSVADIAIVTPAPSTPRIQEVHRTILHAICDLVEADAIATPTDPD